jgi:hypothetical protein
MYEIATRHMNDDNNTFSYNRHWYPETGHFYYHGNKMISNVDGQWLSDAFCGWATTLGTAYLDGGYRARIFPVANTLSDLVGRIVGSMGHASWTNTSNDSYGRTIYYSPIIKTTDSPIQNIFGHSTSATGPFYQSTGIATGGGVIDVNGDSWTNPDFNKMIHVEITSTGATGVSEYKFHVSNITGFIDNTYKNTEVAIPFAHKGNNFDGVTFFDTGTDTFENYEGPAAMEYGDDPTKIVVFTGDYFGKMDLTTGDKVRFHAGSAPAFTGTDISQLCVVPTRANVGLLNPGDIWVADAVTGLHRAHANDGTIDVFDTTHPDLTGLTGNQCYGVTYTPGRIWAAFNGGLAYTDDNGTSFTVYDAGTTPAFTVADFGRIWFLQGDPSHADHRLAVQYNTSSTASTRADLTTYWWDSVSGHGNTHSYYFGSTGTDPRQRREVFRVLSCSPNDNVWGCRSYRNNSNGPCIMNFNATGSSFNFSTYGSLTRKNDFFFRWTKDLAGSDAMQCVWFDFTSSRFSLCKQDGTQVYSSDITDTPLGSTYVWLNRSGDEGLKCFTADGTLILSTIRNSASAAFQFWLMRPGWEAATDALGGEGYHILWKGYGWNGSSWEEGHAGTKTTHAAHEALIDGLTVSFDDAGGTEQFVATDYYTVGIIDGILIDGATEFDHKYALYYKKVEFDHTEIEGGGVLPGTTKTLSRGLSQGDRTTLTDNANVTVSGSLLNGTANGWYARCANVLTNRAYFRFRVDTSSGMNQMTIGLADASKLGTTPTHTNIDYAIRLTPGILGSSNGFRADIVSNGTIVHTITDGSEWTFSGQVGYAGYGVWNRSNEDYMYVNFDRAEGSTDLNVIFRNKVVYTFTGVSSDLVASVRSDSSSNDVRWDSMSTSFSDYAIELGDSGTNVGAFDPNFWAIDYTEPGRPGPDTIKIDGIPASTVYVNDYTTPLAAGEIDILTYFGVIRYSSADAGKTLTIDRYNVILHE